MITEKTLKEEWSKNKYFCDNYNYRVVNSAQLHNV